MADGDLLDTSTIGTHELHRDRRRQRGQRTLADDALHGRGGERRTDRARAIEHGHRRARAGRHHRRHLSTTDEDIGDTFTYSLVDGDGSADNASFSIDGATLRTAETFDYVAKSSYAIRVRTTDAGGKSFERSFTIGVRDFLEPTLTPAEVAENTPAGTIVGTLFDDATSNCCLLRLYLLVPGPGDADNGSFSIEATLRLRATVDAQDGRELRLRDEEHVPDPHSHVPRSFVLREGVRRST